MQLDCFECSARIEADDLAELESSFLAHARANHEWPYPDQAVRNYAAATQRLTGPSERLATLGEVEVHPVTEDRIADWLAFFDHDAFVGMPEWAACYCLEPHVARPGPAGGDEDPPPWTHNRQTMVDRLRSGASFGYLAYVDGRPAGWVNASRRADYTLFGPGPGGEPSDGDVVGVACFIIAPPYRRHGLASALFDRVLADAAGRGARWVEGYPFNEEREGDAGNFRGPRSMYDERGFVAVERGERHTVMRRRV